MYNYIIFYNSGKKYFQFSHFPDKFESKMAASLTGILDDVSDPRQQHNS